MLNNKPLRYILTALFTIGAAAFIAILSFSGMLYLTNSMGTAVASAILAVLIEGEIYKQNIMKGMGMLLQMGQFLENSNYAKKLQALSNNKALRKKCSLLRDYHQVCEHLAKLQALGFLRQTKEQREDQQRAETRKAEIESFFMRYLKKQLSPSNSTESALEAELNLAIGDQKTKLQANIQQMIRREKAWLWASAPVTLLGGGMAAFVTASQLSAAFVSFGVAMTPALMGGFVWPIAGMAAVGFMLMIYKTFVDIIHNKKIITFWNSFKNKFQKATNTTKVLYVVGMALVIGLALAATITTAGTWWTAAQAGLTLLPFLATGATVARTVLSTIGVALMSVGMLLFDYGNSLESIETVASGLPKKGKLWKTLRKKVSTVFNVWWAKDLAEKINPFTWLNRIIEIPFRFILFIGHLISIGVTGDRLGDLNPAISATIGSLQEGMTDIHYLWETANPHDHDHGHHHHHDEACDDHGHKHHHEHHNHAEHHHDHVHTDLAGAFLRIVLAPLKVVAATWNYCFSQRKAGYLGFLKEEFSIVQKPEIKKPKISSEWQHYEADQKLGKAIYRLDHAIIRTDVAKQKKAVLEEHRKTLRGEPKAVHVEEEADGDDEDFTAPLLKTVDLGTHRNRWFAKKPTKSQQVIDEIARECPSVSLSA